MVEEIDLYDIVKRDKNIGNHKYYKNVEVDRFIFQSKEPDTATFEDMTTYVNYFSEKGKNKYDGCRYCVAFYDENLKKWSGSPSIKIGDEIYYKQEYEAEYEGQEINKFIIYVFHTNAPQGGGYGASEKNDCFFEALHLAFEKQTKLMPKGVRTNRQLKESLNLKVDEKIPDDVEYFKKIDELFNKSTALQITGDIEYTTYKNIDDITHTIELIAKDGHINFNTKKRGHIYFTEVPSENIHAYKVYSKSQIVELYNGDEVKKMTIEEYRKFTDQSKHHIFINCKKKTDVIKTVRDNTIRDYDELKEISVKLNKYFLNPYLYASISHYVKELYKQFQVPNISLENFIEKEEKWISASFLGGINYNDKTHDGKMFGVDKNSSYLHTLTKINIPVKQGEFKKLSQDEFMKNLERDMPTYGIYRCNITPTIDERKKYFKMNNYYTHYDVNLAQLLGFDIKICEDGQDNFLCYSKEKLISAKKLFGKYIELFYELKLKHPNNAVINLSLKLVWGIQSQKFKTKKFVKEINDISIDANFPLITKIRPDGDKETDITQFTFRKRNKYFKSNTGRFSCFTTSANRRDFVKDIYKYDDNIVKIQTDAVYFNDEKIINKFTLSTKLGEYKICK